MKNDKTFDAVQFMRQVRDKMSADMRGMSFEEQRQYIEQHASKVRRELPQSVVRTSNRAGGPPKVVGQSGARPPGAR